jgi:hypothetical protein
MSGERHHMHIQCTDVNSTTFVHIYHNIMRLTAIATILYLMIKQHSCCKPLTNFIIRLYGMHLPTSGNLTSNSQLKWCYPGTDCIGR